MDVHDAISARRAYRSLEAMAVTDDLIRDLARHAQLAPSCFNSQPLYFHWKEPFASIFGDTLYFEEFQYLEDET